MISKLWRLHGAPPYALSQLLSRRNPKGQTEQQGEEMSEPRFQYSGRHQKNPPDPSVLTRIGDILDFFKPYKVTARCGFDDESNKYHITFAYEAMILLSFEYVAGEQMCHVKNNEGKVCGPMRFPVLDDIVRVIRSRLLSVLLTKLDELKKLIIDLRG